MTELPKIVDRVLAKYPSLILAFRLRNALYTLSSGNLKVKSISVTGKARHVPVTFFVKSVPGIIIAMALS